MKVEWKYTLFSFILATAVYTGSGCRTEAHLDRGLENRCASAVVDLYSTNLVVRDDAISKLEKCPPSFGRAWLIERLSDPKLKYRSPIVLSLRNHYSGTREALLKIIYSDADQEIKKAAVRSLNLRDLVLVKDLFHSEDVAVRCVYASRLASVDLDAVKDRLSRTNDEHERECLSTTLEIANQIALKSTRAPMVK